jgi:hypothetical protein
LYLELVLHVLVPADGLVEFFDFLFLQHNRRNRCILYLIDVVHQLLVFSGQRDQVGLGWGVTGVGESPIQLQYFSAALRQLFFLATEFFEEVLSFLEL